MSDANKMRETVFGSVPKEVHARLEDTLLSIHEEEKMSKVRLQPILTLLVLLLLCGAAVAAVTSWNVRSVISREDQQGERVINEDFASLIRDVNQVTTGEYLRVKMVDAVFDGKTLAAAWELENLSDDRLLYLIASEGKTSANWDNEGTSRGMDNFLRNGQAMHGSMERIVYGYEGDDTLHVGIHYFVLAPTVEVSYESASSGDGMLVLENGDASYGPYFTQTFYDEFNSVCEANDFGLTQVEAMLATEKFELLEEVEIEFDIEVSAKPLSFLPDGMPIEKAYDDFTMRITRADYTFSTIDVIVQGIFDEEETAQKYRNDNLFGFIALDPNGELSWEGVNSFWGGHTAGADQQEDGTWVIEYIICFRDLLTLPEKMTICPGWSAWRSTPMNGFHYKNLEGVLLTIPSN